MAKSPSHELGEYLGWFIENMMIFEIQPVADELGLYLDHEHLRKARNGNKKVRWFDKHQNHHGEDIQSTLKIRHKKYQTLLCQ